MLAVLVAVAAGAVLAVLLLTGGGTSAPLTVPHLSAAAIDPVSGQILTVLPLQGQPIAALGSGDTVWVANSTDRTLTRIDDRTVAIVATIGLPAQPRGLALGAGRIWVASQDRRPQWRSRAGTSG